MLEQLETKIKEQDQSIDFLLKTVAQIQKEMAENRNKLTYTVKEAAEATGMKVSTIRTWIDSGAMPALRTGKNFLIPAENLLDYLQTLKP